MSGFFARWRKYAKLQALSRRLGIRHVKDILPTDSIEGWLEQHDERKRAKNELYDLVLTDNQCVSVLSNYSADRETLQALYTELLEAGAGQWADSRWIPCYALAEPWSLDFLLRKRASIGIGPGAAFRVVTYYQDNLRVEWLALEPPLEAREQFRLRTQ